MGTRSQGKIDDEIVHKYPNEREIKKNAKKIINPVTDDALISEDESEDENAILKSSGKESGFIVKDIEEPFRDLPSGSKSSSSGFAGNNPVKMPENPERVDATSLALLRDAIKLVPDFDGKRENLARYVMGMEDARAMVGDALDVHLLRLSKTKLSSSVWNRISKITFTGTSELIRYLKKTYDPPRDIYQLTGELGSSFQRRVDSVDDFADRIQALADQIMDAYKSRNNDLPVAEKTRIEEMASKCFQRGLKDEIRRGIGMQPNLSDAINKAKEVEREISDLEQLRANDESKISKPPEKSEKKMSINVVENGNRSPSKGSGAPAVAGGLVCQLCNKSGHAADACWGLQGKSTPVACQLCGQAGHTAAKCGSLAAGPQAVRSTTDQLTVCQICGKRGHLADKCFSIPCRKCGRKGHLTESCFQAQQSAGMQNSASGPGAPQMGQNMPSSPPMQCYACQGWGHMARSCPSRASGQGNPGTRSPTGPPNIRGVGRPVSYAQAAGSSYPSSISCSYCRQGGHVIAECQVRAARYGPLNTQGNGDGLPAPGAQAEANSPVHPTMALATSAVSMHYRE